MIRIRTISPISSPRGGTTLTEVLMAILCMGIGVVAVASLFPIALLRSVQATQLTSGTILRFNAETLIDLHDEIPATDPAKTRNLILNPDFDPASTKTFSEEFQEHFGKHYLIDPLGAMIVRDDNGRPLNTTDQVGSLPRFDALRIFYNTPTYGTATTARQEAEDIVTLPDSWVTLYDEFPESQTLTSVVLPTNTKVDYAELGNIIAGGVSVRIVLFNKNGRLSETRALNASSFTMANTIEWVTPLPDNNQYNPSASPGADPGAVSRIRLEFKERRFTWMLTVRNDTLASAVDPAAARARVDVVIFFRRSPTLEEETPYVINGSGRTYTVSGSNPFLKKGGFMLDTDTGRWHRLQKVNDITQTITLERNTQNIDGHRVVFMRGVVDVYHLGSKP